MRTVGKSFRGERATGGSNACALMTNTSKNQLKRHDLVPNGVGGMQCTNCGKSFLVTQSVQALAELCSAHKIELPKKPLTFTNKRDV